MYPFGWEEICAEYIVGALFPCPALPSPDELTEAPSVCLQDLLSMVSLANPNNTLDIMPGANHSEDCYVECYQTYLINALDFYDSCTGELSSLPPDQCKVITNPELPLATMQTYRAQTCCKLNGIFYFHMKAHCVIKLQLSMKMILIAWTLSFSSLAPTLLDNLTYLTILAP